MANPNIANLTSILGQTSTLDLTTTNNPLVTNVTNSGAVYKLNSLIVANVDGANTVAIDIQWLPNGGAPIYLAKSMNLPAKTSITIIDKNIPIYLTEGVSIYAVASASGDAQAIVSYEVIS